MNPLIKYKVKEIALKDFDRIPQAETIKEDGTRTWTANWQQKDASTDIEDPN